MSVRTWVNQYFNFDIDKALKLWKTGADYWKKLTGTYIYPNAFLDDIPVYVTQLTYSRGNSVTQNTLFFGEDVIKELLNPALTVNEEAELNEFKALSARELEIVKLIAQELSSAEIAGRLFISPGTVENHRHNILKKLNVKNSIGIIKFALKYNLV